MVLERATAESLLSLDAQMRLLGTEEHVKA